MIASGGPITVPSSGTPVQASTNVANSTTRPVVCHGVMFQVLPGNTGKVYIGAKGMNAGARTDLFAILAIPTTNLLPSFSCALTIAPNALCLNDFYVDVDNGDDGVLVTYLVL